MIDPRLMTAVQWMDAVNLTLATIAQLTKVSSEQDWQRWAINLIAVPAIAAYSPPHPSGFPDWRSWAERFVECVPL